MPAIEKCPHTKDFSIGSVATSGQWGRLFPLREFLATTDVMRGLQVDRRAGSTRDAAEPAVGYAKTGNKRAICRHFTGSDGTRTRDLRRDRPVLLVPG